MSPTRTLDSRPLRTIGTLSLLLRALRSLSRGDRRTAVLLVAAAPLAYRSTTLGVLAEVVVRLLR